MNLFCPTLEEVREYVPILIITSPSVGGPDDNFSEGNYSEVGAAWVSPTTVQQSGRTPARAKRSPRHLRRSQRPKGKRTMIKGISRAAFCLLFLVESAHALPRKAVK